MAKKPKTTIPDNLSLSTLQRAREQLSREIDRLEGHLKRLEKGRDGGVNRAERAIVRAQMAANQWREREGGGAPGRLVWPAYGPIVAQLRAPMLGGQVGPLAALAQHGPAVLAELEAEVQSIRARLDKATSVSEAEALGRALDSKAVELAAHRCSLEIALALRDRARERVAEAERLRKIAQAEAKAAAAEAKDLARRLEQARERLASIDAKLAEAEAREAATLAALAAV